MEYHNGEKYVTTHSSLLSSWNYISKPSERLQVLHHCYTYEQTHLLHVADDIQQIISGVLIEINKDLLENYAKLLSRLYSISLKPFYEVSSLSGIANIVKERIEEGISVHKKQLVDFDTVKQRHMLWHRLTSSSYIPLFPCKHILPIICTYWNSVKYVGDQITQMLWERKFY